MPDLVEIAEGFKKYDRIVVTGPQRSGTRIAAKIIADIIRWSWFNEQEITYRGQGHDERYFYWVNDPERQSTVLQCPKISHACHLTPKSTLVVFMLRDVQEILESDAHRMKSFQRHQKTTGKVFSVSSVFTDKRKQYSKLFYDSKELSLEETPQAVYDVWNNIQKKEDFNWYELDYTLLEQHELWIHQATRRAQFTFGTQTKLDEKRP